MFVYIDLVASSLVQATFQEDMLELHFSTGGPGLRFVSASAEQITIAVNHIMSRWKLSQPVRNFPLLCIDDLSDENLDTNKFTVALLHPYSLSLVHFKPLIDIHWYLYHKFSFDLFDVVLSFDKCSCKIFIFPLIVISLHSPFLKNWCFNTLQASKSSASEKKIRPKDVPGTLLNIVCVRDCQDFLPRFIKISDINYSLTYATML